jgi:hypothetical protein
MIVSHRYKFIFIKTRKTASTSLEAFLSRHCAAEDIFTPIYPPLSTHVPRNYRGFFNPVPEMMSGSVIPALTVAQDVLCQRKFYNHIPARSLRHRLPPEIWDSYFKFCIERNPWDKIVSCYHMQCGLNKWNKSFGDYLDKGKFPLNYPLYLDHDHKILVDRMIRFERLYQDLGEVLEHLRIPYPGFLEVQAKSEYRQHRRPYQEYFTDSQRDFVAKVFSVEIDLHHYQF